MASEFEGFVKRLPSGKVVWLAPPGHFFVLSGTTWEELSEETDFPLGDFTEAKFLSEEEISDLISQGVSFQAPTRRTTTPAWFENI